MRKATRLVIAVALGCVLLAPAVAGEAEDVARLREQLRSDDTAQRLEAAFGLSSFSLDAEELGLQARAVANDPEWARTGRVNNGIFEVAGAPEFLVALHAATRSQEHYGFYDHLTELHRAMTPGHIPGLVALLDTPNRDIFRSVSRLLRLAADETDLHRDEVARGLVYILRRIEWERAARDAPAGAKIPPQPLLTAEPAPVGKGLGDPLRTLLAHTFELAEPWFVSDGEFSLYPPYDWLRRRLAESRPVEDDVPFLLALAKEEDDLILPWAVRKLAEAAGTRADAVLAELADDEDQDHARVAAAAVLALRGDRVRYDAWLEAESDALEDWEWAVDPETVRGRWLEHLRAGGDQGELSAEERRLLNERTGITIRPEDLAWFDDQMTDAQTPLPCMVRWFTDTNPAGLSPALVGAVARRVSGAKLVDGEVVGRWGAPADPDQSPAAVLPLLGLLEVRAPESLKALTATWMVHDDTAGLARAVRARMGWEYEGTLPDEFLWWGARRLSKADLKSLRGRVERVRDPILIAVAVHFGLPERARFGFEHALAIEDCDELLRRIGVVDDAVPAATVIDAVFDGRPVDALIALAPANPASVSALGLTGDPRALAWLRERRDARHERQYWECTLGLAASGDADALAEIASLLRENRTWMLDGLRSLHWRALARRPGIAELSIDRFGHNCCSAFQSHSILAERYPTLPVDAHGPGGNGDRALAIREWVDEHDFVHTRILDAWLPR